MEHTENDILRKIIEAAISSMDTSGVKRNIINELGKSFNADRCYFRSFEKSNHKFFPPEEEYLKDDSIKSMTNLKPRQKALKYFTDKLEKLKRGFYPIIIDKNIKDRDLKDYMDSIGVKRIYACPIIEIDEECIWLVLHYLDDSVYLDQKEIELLEIIAYYVGVTLNQLKLYEKVKKQNEREILLRKNLENMRISLDIEEILDFICSEVAKLFNVQRAVLVHYPEKKADTIFITRKEYKLSSKFKSIKNKDDFREVARFWSESVIRAGDTQAFDDIQQSAVPEIFKQTYKELGVKSAIGSPIKKNNVVWGILILFEYNKMRIWTEEEKNLLSDIANQIFIAITQSELYSTIRKKAEIENVLRKIMLASINKFDPEEIIKLLVTEISSLFNADRGLFLKYSDYDSDTKLINPFEYLSDSKTESSSAHVPDEKTIDRLIESLKTRDLIISEDTVNDDLTEESRKILIDTLHIKSYIMIPLFYSDEDFGAIVLHYVKNSRQFNEEEIELIKAIANQSAAVIHHAKLYKEVGKNERYIRAVLESIQDGIITMDETFTIKSCNPAVKSIWGYDIDECIGKEIQFLFNCDQSQTCLSKDALLGVRQNGESFPVEVVSSDILTDYKKDILLAVRDITERKKMEQMKNEFVSTVSHELRTPLTSLRGSLGLIMSGKMGDLSEKIKGLLDIANNNCTRLINLINDILDIEKIEAGKMDFDIKDYDLILLIKQAIELNQQFAQKFNVQIKFIQNLGNVTVNVDSSRLIQVITNLLSNAIKFSNSGSNVDVITTEIENKIRVSVINYGAEIPENFKTRIFQKFAQADSSDSRQKGGTGLGLSISKAIIEKMNGNINFISEDNQTKFYFELPEVSAEKDNK